VTAEHHGAGPFERLRSLSPIQLAIVAGLVGLAALVVFAPRGGGGGDRASLPGVVESDLPTPGGEGAAAGTAFPTFTEPQPRQPGRQAATVDGPKQPGESEGPPSL
jgi:hypothetical protein